MSNVNGFIPRSQLVEVQKGILLATMSARAFRHAAAAFYHTGRPLSIAAPGGGYRDSEVQTEMWKASRGNSKLALKWGLNPHSTVPVASPGNSSHGDGTRADFLFGGSSQPSETEIKILARYGWTREFGQRDPNHFRHTTTKGTTPVTREFCVAHGLFVQPAKKK